MKTLLLTLTISFLSHQALAVDCIGTEPFWSATLSSEKVELSDAGEQEILVTPITKITAADGFTSDFLQVYANNNGPVAIVTSNNCNDSMSDFIYPNEVIIFTGEGTRYGCCGEGKLQ